MPKILLVLHGWQSSKEKWAKVKKEIEKQGIKVIAPDLPGFKKELDKPWDLDNYLEWLEMFVEKNSLKLNNGFYLLGHSFGGRIALKFARKYPEALKGLILVSPAGTRKKINPMIKIFASIAGFFSFMPGYELLRKIFYFKILRKGDYFKASGNLKETFKKVVSEDLSYIFEYISTPTLLIWGEKDDYTPIEQGYLMNKKISNSKMEILKGLSHTPYLENPELLAEKIIGFIK